MTTATDLGALALTIKRLTPEEKKLVWESSRRQVADNYESFFLHEINASEIGEAFDVPVPAKTREQANAIKYNFTEACKERSVEKVVPAGAPDPEGMVGEPKVQADGSRLVRVHAACVPRYKTDYKKVKRTVTKDGKKVEEEVEEVTWVRVHLVASEAVRKRAPRTVKPADATANGEVKPDQKPTDDTPAPFENADTAGAKSGEGVAA